VQTPGSLPQVSGKLTSPTVTIRRGNSIPMTMTYRELGGRKSSSGFSVASLAGQFGRRTSSRVVCEPTVRDHCRVPQRGRSARYCWCGEKKLYCINKKKREMNRRGETADRRGEDVQGCKMHTRLRVPVQNGLQKPDELPHCDGLGQRIGKTYDHVRGEGVKCVGGIAE
jgi:hypothetical protein